MPLADAIRKYVLVIATPFDDPNNEACSSLSWERQAVPSRAAWSSPPSTGGRLTVGSGEGVAGESGEPPTGNARHPPARAGTDLR